MKLTAEQREKELKKLEDLFEAAIEGTTRGISDSEIQTCFCRACQNTGITLCFE